MAEDRGSLILVVGPSGAGKDTLLRYAEHRLAGHPRILFPRRVITRSGQDATELHQPMSAEEFARAAQDGAFVLSWQAHGLSYGIPATVIADLRAGVSIAVNVSRSVVGKAAAQFERIAVIQVIAPGEALAERLSHRGRESREDVAQRLARTASALPADIETVTIANDSTIEAAGEKFVAALMQLCGHKNPVVLQIQA